MFKIRALAIAGPLLIVFGCMAALLAAGVAHDAAADAGVVTLAER